MEISNRENIWYEKMTKRYKKLQCIPGFHHKMKRDQIDLGFPTLIKYQEWIVEQENPIHETIFKKTKRRKNLLFGNGSV